MFGRRWDISSFTAAAALRLLAVLAAVAPAAWLLRGPAQSAPRAWPNDRLPQERFIESAGAEVKRIPPGLGFERLTEAVTSEFRALIDLVRSALREKLRLTPELSGSDYYIDIQGIWSDSVVAELKGRLYRYPYSISADNSIVIGDGVEVVKAFTPVTKGGAKAVQPMAESVGDVGADVSLREAADGSIEVTLIRAGVSKNNAFYGDAALQAAVPLFEGVRVFAKSDAEHVRGGGKDVRNLLGGVYGVRFAPGTTPDAGALVGIFKPIDPTDAVVTKMTEAVKRGLQGLLGLSIDAMAHTKRTQRDGKTVREATQFTKVNSVDLIVEPGAGGGLDRLTEAAADDETFTETTGASMFKLRLLAALAAINAARAQGIKADATDDDVSTALREACAAIKVDFSQVAAAALSAANDAGVAAGVQRVVEAVTAQQQRMTESVEAPVTRAELEMFRTRSAAALKINACTLPAAAKQRLQAQFDARERFTEADVDAAVKSEREYLAQFTESGRVALPAGATLEVGDRREQVRDMLDAFFDPAHKNHRAVQSFKECYVEITGDRRVTGRIQDCDRNRLCESLGVEHYSEAIASGTFANALGDSITRRMVAVYLGRTDLQAWRRVATVGPVNDFRSQERVTMGGYGNLPAVAQGAAYTALTSPGDQKATFAVSKRGGLETVTLEAIKNDDVQVIRRVPVELAHAAGHTLYEFVMDFFRTNPVIYDTVALYHASRGNLFSAALSATEFAAHRLAMATRTRLSSAKRRGVTPSRVLVPFELQETAYNLFVRNQNLDKTFIQSVNPEVLVVPYWTDANDWCTVADPAEMPVLEVGFLDGREEPELFMQDMPNVGSLFSNDVVTYKIRHIYGAAVLPEGEKATTKAVVA